MKVVHTLDISDDYWDIMNLAMTLGRDWKFSATSLQQFYYDIDVNYP